MKKDNQQRKNKHQRHNILISDKHSWAPPPICSFCKTLCFESNTLLVVNNTSFTVKVTWGGGWECQKHSSQSNQTPITWSSPSSPPTAFASNSKLANISGSSGRQASQVKHGWLLLHARKARKAKRLRNRQNDTAILLNTILSTVYKFITILLCIVSV